jgi:hypothetical protein
MEALENISERYVKHPPYSQDLVQCDFWAFPVLKLEV